MPAGINLSCINRMPQKKKKTEQQIPLPPPHNPADEGVDHNVSRGTEQDLKDTYIQKQETNDGRGVDNEESTDEIIDPDSNK